MLEKLQKIISEYTDLPESEITENTNIRTDLNLNSLELVNLAVAIEDEFEVEIPDREALGIETVGDVIALIQRYQA
ncbi:MAG: acyl carrier protein [Clostridia bacterium]|jgi:acyl carrier protein|nr:acyl carrier protein [Clostridia bacterium]MBQ4365996.1 acyl carrier protein [Clostridia bacterium]MBQ6093342.1 acyl carrier protein [Clostridia bacterium]MBR3095147.1 acyl carrier protein [Clostridia bacterium]